MRVLKIGALFSVLAVIGVQAQTAVKMDWKDKEKVAALARVEKVFMNGSYKPDTFEGFEVVDDPDEADALLSLLPPGGGSPTYHVSIMTAGTNPTVGTVTVREQTPAVAGTLIILTSTHLKSDVLGMEVGELLYVGGAGSIEDAAKRLRKLRQKARKRLEKQSK